MIIDPSCVSNGDEQSTQELFDDCVFPYLFIDASTEGYEEEVYEEEQEEHCANCANCANCTNQGKLIPMQALLVQDSKDTLANLFIQGTFPIPSLILQSFTFLKSLFIVHLCLVQNYYKSYNFSLATQIQLAPLTSRHYLMTSCQC